MSSSPLQMLTTPVAVWHESRLSARTDALTSLSTSQAFIRTDRPLPPGTPVYLDLDAGNGGACIDAIAASVDVGGFAVDFLTVDDRARLIIESRLAAERPASEPKSGLVEQPAIALSRTATQSKHAGVGVDVANVVANAAPVGSGAVFGVERLDTPTVPAGTARPAPRTPAPAPTTTLPPAAEVPPELIARQLTPASFAAPPTSVGPVEPPPAPLGELVMQRTRTDELFAVETTPAPTTTPAPRTPPSAPSRTRTAPLGMPAFHVPDAPMPDVPTTPAFGQRAPTADPSDAHMAPTPSARVIEEPPPSPRTTQELVLTGIDLTLPPGDPSTLELVPPASLAPPTPSPTPAPTPPTPRTSTPTQPWSRALAANLPMDESPAVENTQRWPTAVVRADAPMLPIALPAQGREGASDAPATSTSTPVVMTQPFAITPVPLREVPLPQQQLTTTTTAPQFSMPKTPTPSTTPAPGFSLGADLGLPPPRSPPPPLPSSEVTAPWPVARVKQQSDEAPPLPAPPKTPTPAAAPTAAPISTMDAVMDVVVSGGFEITFDEAFGGDAPAVASVTSVIAPPTTSTTPPTPTTTVPAPATMPPMPAAAAPSPAAPPGPGALDFDAAFEVEFTAPRAASKTVPVAARPLPQPDDEDEGGVDVVDVDFSEFKDVIGVGVTFRSEGPPPPAVDLGKAPLRTSTRPPTPPGGSPAVGRPSPAPPLVRASVAAADPMHSATPVSPPLGGSGATPAARNPFAGESQPPLAAATIPPMFAPRDATQGPDNWQVTSPQPPLARAATPPSSLPAPRLLDDGFNAMLKNSGSNSSTPRPGAFPPQDTPAPAPLPAATAAPVPAPSPSPKPPPLPPKQPPASPLAALPLAPVMVTSPGDEDLPVIGGAAMAVDDEDDLPVIGGALAEAGVEEAEDWSFGPPTSPGRLRPAVPDAPLPVLDPNAPRKA